MNVSCDRCFEPTGEKPLEGETLCGACRRWDQYWNSLDAPQQREEIRLMDLYTEETKEWQ